MDCWRWGWKMRQANTVIQCKSTLFLFYFILVTMEIELRAYTLSYIPSSSCLFWHSVSISHTLVQVGLELVIFLPPPSRELWLQICTTIPSHLIFSKLETCKLSYKVKQDAAFLPRVTNHTLNEVKSTSIWMLLVTIKSTNLSSLNSPLISENISQSPYSFWWQFFTNP